MIEKIHELEKYNLWYNQLKYIHLRQPNAGDVDLIPGLERFLREEMATHSIILAWEIPWTEEPGRLQSTGLQRVGHD